MGEPVVERSLLMYRVHAGYLASTRHPWPCLLFLLPLLLAYECGVLWLADSQPELLRNGADAWLRWGLEAFGFHQLYWAPGFILVIFLGWSWSRRWDKPKHLTAIYRGMILESLLFAAGLFAISRMLGPFPSEVRIHLSPEAKAKAMGQIVTFVGAGIYEELLFRLLLFLGLGCLLRLADVSRLLTATFTTLASATLFAAAHHIGPYGEPFNHSVFLFRTMAGLYFALLYQLRGFGIAVGTHTCYDVLVGVLMV
jgi:membrane protease YdiL (CAAX protease family)